LQKSLMAAGTAVGVTCFFITSLLPGRTNMLAKSIAAGLAATTMLAGVAFAQTPTTTADRANTSSATVSESSVHGDWRTSKMTGLNVYNDKNENIGSIDDLLMDKSGSIKVAVISVGGFLGVGSRLVAIPFDKIKFVDQPVPSGTAQNNAKSNTTTGAATTNSSQSTAKSNPWYPDHAVFNATKDELKTMPEFKFSDNK
jgi:sporulation protein YlmC with PRC-barrel domain